MLPGMLDNKGGGGGVHAGGPVYVSVLLFACRLPAYFTGPRARESYVAVLCMLGVIRGHACMLPGRARIEF